ncbi:MAG: GNAT family N-acetyltransferase, partial [Dehalococcoidales bacterium]
ARLIFTSGADLYRYIFATQEPEIYDYIIYLCSRPGSLFSKNNIIIEEENDIIRGLILAYPARDMIKISMQMIKSIPGMFRICGFKRFMQLMFRMGLNRYFPGIEHDELFISNLAVFEEHRGRGIGSALLQKAEDIARESHLEKLSLYVESDNHNAIRVYENFGFINVKESFLPQKYERYNLFGFYKMVKGIETGE